MKITNRSLMTAADLPCGVVEKLKESISKYDLRNRENSNEGTVLPLTEVDSSQNPYMTKLELTRDEANLMKGFRLEEYVELIKKMKVSDPEAYRLHQERLRDAEDKGDISAKVREYTKPYTWAYGDILEIIHKDNPDLDIFIKSEGTPEEFEFRSGQEKRKNRPCLIISTAEIRLLQSKDLEDKEKQDKLWRIIWDRVKR